MNPCLERRCCGWLRHSVRATWKPWEAKFCWYPENRRIPVCLESCELDFAPSTAKNVHGTLGSSGRKRVPEWAGDFVDTSFSCQTKTLTSFQKSNASEELARKSSKRSRHPYPLQHGIGEGRGRVVGMSTAQVASQTARQVAGAGAAEAGGRCRGGA